MIILLAKKNKVADYLSFCPIREYENYQINDDNFILTIDSFLKGEKLIDDACKKLSFEFENSTLNDELLKLENDLNSSESAMKQILQF